MLVKRFIFNQEGKMKKSKLFAGALLGALLLVACAGSETVTVRETVEVPVTVQVVEEVEVTRQVEVEVTRQVEVTRAIEVTREMEVTRIVEREVTAVPTDTPVPTETPVPPQATAVPATPTVDVSATLLQTMIATRLNMQDFGGLIDKALRDGVINCQTVVDTYDAIAGAQTYDVGGGSDVTQNAYNGYRAAVDIFATGARDMAQNCRDFLANPASGSIPFQQWGLARQSVNEAIDALHAAIQVLEAQGS
jgi:hypothetical protein